MRIVGGRFKGRSLAALGAGDRSAHLRPTTDRVRETLFNVLAHGGYTDPALPQGARVLDLFAGTGALGLEALSRGASYAQFVDDGATARGLIQKNITTLDIAEHAHLLRKDATRLGVNQTEPFDLIFLDPPYGKALGERALTAAVTGNWLKKGALIVWEENSPPPIAVPFHLLDQRRYGDTIITLLRHEA